MKLNKWFTSVLAGTTMLSAGAAAAEVVSIGLPASHSFFGTHLYVAEELGYFGDLDIEYMIFKGGSEVAKQVANGSADIGFAQPTEILISSLAAAGETLPVKYWYMLETRSANEIAVPVASDIQTIQDIKGRAVGISSPTASNVAQFRVILARHGIDPDKDVVWREVGLGAGHVQALLDGTIDVSATNNMRHAAYQFEGVDLRVIPMEDTADQFGNGLFSSLKTIETRPDTLAVIASGVAKATAYCAEMPAECVKILYKKFPELQSADRSDEDNLKFGLGQVAARNETAALREDQKGVYGYFPESVWKASVDFLSLTTEIPTDLDVSVLYTNDIVERAAGR